MIDKHIREICIRLPFIFPNLKKEYLKQKFLAPIRFKGSGNEIHENISVTRRNGLVLGSSVTIEGKNRLISEAGIAIGDHCTLARNVNINTISKKGYDPVVIGASNHITNNISPGTFIAPKSPVSGLSSFKGQIVFVLSCGRSGSKAIANFLNTHTDIDFYHDSFPHIYPWSNEVLYKTEKAEIVKQKLYALYNSMDFKTGTVHGQSDQKLAPLVPILDTLFPKAKYIWLIRSAKSFVKSSYQRGWFSNSEFNLPASAEDPDIKRRPSKFDAFHRTDGYKTGHFTEKEWSDLSSFGRNCWYWSFWNGLINDNLKAIPPHRKLKLKLEDLNSAHESLSSFLNLDLSGIKVEKVNQSRSKDPLKWTDEMNKLLDKFTGKNMFNWYGD